VSFDAHVAKKNTTKGTIYLIIGLVFLIPFLSIWFLVFVVSNGLMEPYTIDTWITMSAGMFFPFIGIPLCLKGIITLVKRRHLSDREFMEQRILQLEEEKYKSQTADSSENKESSTKKTKESQKENEEKSEDDFKPSAKFVDDEEEK